MLSTFLDQISLNALHKRRAKRAAYEKSGDSDLLPLIRALVDARPTYGYRRITALLNRQFGSSGAPRVNHKRIFRIMHVHGLLLQRYTGRRNDRAHDGVVRTLRSNTRWCSDGFEIPCWNHETVRVAFTLDTCDREAITWTATTAGISGEMVRDMMLGAVEQRFGRTSTPNRVEYLTDNGSCYTATETVRFALALGLLPCFTPVRRPESNGMAESFVKTFKPTTFAAILAPTLKPFSIASILGSKITTTRTRTDRLKCYRRGSSSMPTYLSRRVRFDGGNSTDERECRFGVTAKRR